MGGVVMGLRVGVGVRLGIGRGEFTFLSESLTPGCLGQPVPARQQLPPVILQPHPAGTRTAAGQAGARGGRRAAAGRVGGR